MLNGNLSFAGTAVYWNVPSPFSSVCSLHLVYPSTRKLSINSFKTAYLLMSYRLHDQGPGSLDFRLSRKGKPHPVILWDNNSWNAQLLWKWVNGTENCSNYCQLKVRLWALGELEEKIQTLSSKAISLHIVVCPFSECSLLSWDCTCGHG